MNGDTSDERIREEIEFARALTAVLLAVRLEVAEVKARDAYETIARRVSAARGN